MFGIRLRKLATTLGISSHRQLTVHRSNLLSRNRFRGGFRAFPLALCLALCCIFATVALASEAPSFAQPAPGEDAVAPALDTLAPALGSVAPVLTVSGETVSWAPVGTETYYEVAISNAPRGAAGRTTKYLSVPRTGEGTQSYSLTLQPEQTVYVGVSADNSPAWSVEEATVTTNIPVTPEPPATEPPAKEPPVTEPPTTEPPSSEPPVTEKSAPVLSVVGETLEWTAIPGSSRYTLATILNPTTTRETTYKIVTGTSYTPPAQPGRTVTYGLSASAPGEAPWAREVAITYPPTTTPPKEPTGPTEPTEPTPPETPTPPVTPPSTGKIIGTNDGAGWGVIPAATMIAGHITWNRVEVGEQLNTVPISVSDGFKVLAIVGNTNDSTPLSQSEPNLWGAQVVSEILANPGISIAEAGNEMYFKGGVGNPVQYGKMYLAAVNAMHATGIHIPLLFNMWGNYSSSSGYSSDSNGGGWLRDAVKGVPGLSAAILANGLSTHPYGAIGENDDDENGVSAVAAQESVAKAVLGSTPPFYITEFGYDLGRCGSFNGACSEQEQAEKLGAAYKVFLSDPQVKGIWWYESHDDGTGKWGFMNGNNTTRPAFDVLSAFAQEQGQ